MARSTPIVMTAGGLAALDVVMNDYRGAELVRIAVGTVGAALVSAGLDRVMPGLGTGAAALLCTAVVLTSGPRIANKIKK